MTINDRGGAATMTHRRNFLIGIASLIVAPAVVRAEALMPIVVWRPTFYKRWPPWLAVHVSWQRRGSSRLRPEFARVARAVSHHIRSPQAVGLEVREFSD
jgi:hypothetical protein